MNSFNNCLEVEQNTNLKYLIRYKLNQKGQKIYENN